MVDMVFVTTKDRDHLFPCRYAGTKPLILKAWRFLVTDITLRPRHREMIRSASVPRILTSESLHGLFLSGARSRIPKECLLARILLDVRLMIRASSVVESFESSFSSSGIHGSDLVAFGNFPVLK